MIRKYLRSKHVLHIYGDISPMTLWRKVESGAIPPPDLKLAGQNIWFEETIEEHQAKEIKSQIKIEEEEARLTEQEQDREQTADEDQEEEEEESE